MSTFKQEELPGSVFSSLLLTRPHVLRLASVVESPSLKVAVLLSFPVRVAPVCPVWFWGSLWICLRPAQTLRRGRDLCQDRVWVGLPRPWQTSLNCLNQSLHMLAQLRWPRGNSIGYTEFCSPHSNKMTKVCKPGLSVSIKYSLYQCNMQKYIVVTPFWSIDDGPLI